MEQQPGRNTIFTRFDGLTPRGLLLFAKSTHTAAMVWRCRGSLDESDRPEDRECAAETVRMVGCDVYVFRNRWGYAVVTYRNVADNLPGVFHIKVLRFAAFRVGWH